jgi:hypothetical protein
MIRDRIVSLIYRTCSFLLILYGLMSHLKILSGAFRLSSLMYYTIQSNLLAAVLFYLLLSANYKALIKEGRRGRTGFCERFAMICVVDLLLTLIVYWTMLAPAPYSAATGFNLGKFDNVVVHLLAPLLCLADYLIFTTPGQIKYRDVYVALVFPLLYALFSTVVGYAGYTYRISAQGIPVHFPYFFLNFEQLVVLSLWYIAAITAVLLVIGHALYWFDQRRPPASTTGLS